MLPRVSLASYQEDKTLIKVPSLLQSRLVAERTKHEEDYASRGPNTETLRKPIAEDTDIKKGQDYF